MRHRSHNCTGMGPEQEPRIAFALLLAASCSLLAAAAAAAADLSTSQLIAGHDGGYVTDLGSIPIIAQLRHLGLSGSARLSDLQPLVGCTRLRHLLQHLDLSHCSLLSDLGPLEHCTELQHLDLSHCHLVSELNPIRMCSSHLRTIVVDCCSRLKNLGPLCGFLRLRTIRLKETDVGDLGPLSKCTQLMHVSLGGTAISDLGPLRGCLELRDLDLVGSHVQDLGALITCTQLRHLNIEGCPAGSSHGAYGGVLRDGGVKTVWPFSTWTFETNLCINVHDPWHSM